MRILQVLHFFLPKHSAGTEVYTDSLSRELLKRGHEVHLFFTEKILSRRNFDVIERDQDGLRCHVLINNLLYDRFEETFRNEAAKDAFADVLREVRPDVIHFQHLMLLSLDLPSVAARLGIPSVMSLHDFWLYCPRFGQLMEHGETVCKGPQPRRCAACLSDFKYSQTTLQKKVISAIRWTSAWSGFDLAPIVDAWRGSKLAGAGKLLQKSGAKAKLSAREASEADATLRADLIARERAVREMIPHVRAYLSPSRTVRDRMIAFGLPRRKVKLLPLGIDPVDVPERKPLEGRDPVFGFIGTLSPHKGVHVAVEAMRYLKGRGELVVYGRRDYYPAYASSLQALGEGLNVKFPGSIPRARIGEAFARIDVLVMPSVWLENFPIIIQEARATRVPVVASNLGGMKEAIRDGVDGLLFKVGDPKDLARKLASLVHHPERIAQMSARSRHPLSVEKHVDTVEVELERAISEAAAESDR